MNDSPPRTVLYLTYDGLSDHIGQSQIMPYLLACRAAGIPIHIISFEKSGKEAQMERIQNILDAAGIVWHRMSFTIGRGMHLKLRDFMRFIQKAFRVSKAQEFAVIHSRSYIASAIGLLVARRRKAKLIFDKRDFWIDAVVETDRLRPKSSLIHRMAHASLRYFERRLFLESAHIISLTHRAKEIVLGKYPSRKADEITVIPCCADVDLFNPDKVNQGEVNAKRSALGIPDDAVVFGYVGSIGAAYKVPELLQCFGAIKARIPKARLLFLVNNDPGEVRRLARTAGLADEDVFVASAPRAEVPLYIALIHYGFFFIMPSFAKQATSPTKQYEMLAMGKRIISNKGVGDAEQVFSELDCGYLIDGFTAGEYVKAAEWIAANPPLPRIYDLSHYSLQWGAAQYLKVYQKMLAS